MAAASYDQLLKQVEALKMENTNLRQELEDNSNHLTKLESEASNMKEVLKQLQGSIEDEAMASSGQIDLLERLKELNLDGSNFPGVKLRPKMSLRSYGSREGSVSGRSGECSPVPMGSFPRRAFVNGSRESTGYMEELEKERSLLIAELEKEEKEKDWYYAQLQNLTKRIDSLPLTENFSLQTDMTRRQLEFEARQIRAAMEEQLGTCQDMEKRAQARVARIQQIEKDIFRIRQVLQSQAAEAERTPQSKHDAGSRDAEKQPDGTGTSETVMGTTVGSGQGSATRVDHDTSTAMNSSSTYSVPRRLTSHLGTKVEMVYSLLSMLGTHDKDDMSRTLLAMSSSQDSCIAMRQSGCLPLLIQLLHGNDKDSVLLGNSRGSKEARARASAALHNIIHSQPDDKRGRREIRVLHLLEQIRAYCETCWEWQEAHEQGMDQDKNPMPAPVEHQICPAVCVLMKLSFDEEHRHAMNELGGLQAIAELLQVDCEMYGLINDHYSVTLRRYAGMALTNLTFGDVANKATLCSMKSCMRALVAQLKSESEDLQQVIASVLRNLSWRADVNSKKTLREVGSVKALMECALEVKKESTLKSVLSALWNLSAHCTENKADICSVDGSLAFLVSTLTYRSQTNTLAIIESGGGILRNVSSLIATNEDHRQILRENNCLQTLLQHLKSHSLTIVSNACGTLWNLSARNAKDQEALWDLGAVSMLKNLIHSKHKMIAMGSAAALRNLMANRPAKYKDANIMSPGSSVPSLHVRKQKALEAELDAQHLSETFDNIDNLSPKTTHRNKQRHKQNLYSDYVLDTSRHDDAICRSDNFTPGNITVLSPYMNTTVLPLSSSGRPNGDGNRPEKDRERTLGLNNYHSATDNAGNTSKRIGLQLSTTAQMSKVIDEVSSMHISQEDRNSGSSSEMHCVSDERTSQRKTSTNHPHSNAYNSGRGCQVSYTKMEYKRASNDSLNSVSSTDGYGKRGQVKPSVESYSEDDESKFCSYGQYPADLAHKIHSANHMDDNDTELDTPINYSLKYSDEQLNSGRQSPTQNERWARPKHVIDNEIKQNEQRQPRNPKTQYPAFSDKNEEKQKKIQPHYTQPESSSPYRSRGVNNQADQARGGSNLGINQKPAKPHCQVDDYDDDDKPTNFSERYSEEEQQEEENERQTNYSITPYNQEEHHVEQPIDYSRKYPADVAPPAQKPSFSFAKNSSKQRGKKDPASSSGNTPTPSPNTNRQNQLHSTSAQTRSGQTRQKQTSSKPPSINQETMQTYCVEDTPICFSRCSSLSSLSSAEDEIEGRERGTRGTDANNTLQITELKDNRGTTSKEGSVNETRSTSHHTRSKTSRTQSSNLSPSDTSRHKTVEFTSGAKSPSKSGAQTPKSPPEHYVQETPLMFSRCTSVSSLDSFESHSIASSVQSEPCSGMVSGIISPSDLPDSPGQTMPPSRSKTPPPPQAVQMKRDANKPKLSGNAEERECSTKQTAVHAAAQRVQVLQEADTLLHFATESTPDGFSCASSLSALSLDEPYIQKDVELKMMPPVLENDQANEAESDKSKESTDHQEKKEDKQSEPEKDILDDTDDDIDILEECIISAMPTKSSRKNKKSSQPSTSKTAPPVARKPSQLPVYKLLPSQNRVQAQKHVSFTHTDDMPRVYCVEGTPINFSTATSLSDLTIESPPNEFANNDQPNNVSKPGNFEKRDTIPTDGRSTDDKDTGKSLNNAALGLDEDKTEEGDILAECIHSAMPKGKSHKPFRVKKIMDQIHHTSTGTPSSRNAQEGDKKKPTSPVKPMPQTMEYKNRSKKNQDTKIGLGSEKLYGDPRKQIVKNNPREVNDKLPNNEERAKGSFAFDSPHHYTPIEGTPYCFSRNDSLSSLDFEDDDIDLSREKAELRKEKETKQIEPKLNKNNEHQSSNQSAARTQPSQNNAGGKSPPKALLHKQASFPPASKAAPDRGGATDEQMQNFAIENTPVCFSRNSSLSSLSDIDQENNNKETEATKQTEPSGQQLPLHRPQTSGYAPKSFHVEDTPVCFSRNSSLSSLSIDSEDDLLQECISSAMPKKKKPSKNKGENEKNRSNNIGGILSEEPDLSLDLRDLQSPDSENAFSPDSENFDWKAIQEGANSIVSRLHQAAAGVSLSRQGSSDSDSILSLKSGISLGSPFHITPDKEEKPITNNKGPRIVKPGEKSSLENKKSEEEPKSIKGGKKVYKSIITGKSRSSSDFSSQCKQSIQSNMPSISRGRTMIHIPGVRASSPSTSPVAKKGPVMKTPPSKGPIENQNSTSSPRGPKPLKPEPVYINRPASTPGGSSKGPSRSGSRDSTPSRPNQQPLSRPMQSPGRSSISPGRNGISPPNKFSQLPRTASPSTASTKSSGSGRMSYTSPGRQMSQQNLKQSGLPKTPSSIPRSESASKGLNQSTNSTGSNKKVELSRMSSTKSSGSESDKSERPALVRQSTFIKEAPSPTLRRKLEESASFESLSSSSRADSPTRSQTQTPVLSPSLPDMSLSTHSIQAGGWRKMPPNLNPPAEPGDGRGGKRHDISRSHSESPSRLPITRSGTWKREHSKHSSSLPRVSTWRRTGSSSSILSASSESSEKAKSEDEKQLCSFPGPRSNTECQPSAKGTWRKIKESEILETASNGSSNTIAESNSSVESKTLLYQMAPPVSKTEDVWVRIEDCPINNPRSGKSPTGNTPPVIDNILEQGEKDEPVRDCQGRHNSGNGNVPVIENRQKSFIKVDGADTKGIDPKPVINTQPVGQETNENSVSERTPFSSSSSSKHSSPSGTVAARVTPFNYNPSPRKSNSDSGTTRPSQIPTPVAASTKKSDAKTESPDSSGSQSPKRHSGSYLVTSV
ncbi:adenomatous polyposis coli protein isoform 2-T2 [Discoglossus pictus]